MEAIKLNSGHQMPTLGFGTWKVPAEMASETVQAAIDAGYRHIDCAYAYQNEKAVGEGIQAKMADGTVTREQLFVTTKLWNVFHRKDLVRKGFMDSLTDLKLSYVDLFLIHWPVAFKEDGPIFTPPKQATQFSDSDYVDTYKEMEQLVDEGLVRSIGLANFNSKQIQRILDNCTIKPDMLQVECNPRFNQKQLVDFCKEKGIPFTAFSPLGSPDRPWAPEGEQTLFEDPTVIQIANKHEKTPGQVLIRYPLQRGLVVLAKSSTQSRMKENLQVMDFELSCDDMAALDSLHTGKRAVELTRWLGSKYYPFTEPF